MTITTEKVRHVAKLARLKIEEAELERLAEQLDNVLQYMESLNAVDTSGVPPTAHVLSACNAFRPDSARTSMNRDEALSNAPETEDGFFVVPKIIE